MKNDQPSNQRSLNEVTLRLNAIIETAIDGIITINKSGIIDTVNQAACDIFNYEKEELIGKNISLLMPSPHRESHDGYIGNYLKSGHAKIIGIGREVRGKKKNGQLFPMRLAVSEFKIEDKIVFTGIVHDLSEVKKAESAIQKLNQDLEKKVHDRTETLAEVVNQLLSSNKQLEKEISDRINAENKLLKIQNELRLALEKEKELNELKSRFVSMASHEFRTPLSTILSSVSIINRYTETEQQGKREKHVKRIKSSVKNLIGILHDFLSLSRLEEGDMVPKYTHFDIKSFIEHTISQLEGMLKKNQNIVLEIDDENEEIFEDKQMLQNILFNLLSNAIKYSEENSNITCSVKKDGGFLELKVKDQGIGIPEEDQVHLFTRFFRANNAMNIQGTGLGLNIVRRYVNLLQGEISFESTLGEGSQFTVQIPLKKEVI